MFSRYISVRPQDMYRDVAVARPTTPAAQPSSPGVPCLGIVLWLSVATHHGVHHVVPLIRFFGVEHEDRTDGGSDGQGPNDDIVIEHILTLEVIRHLLGSGDIGLMAGEDDRQRVVVIHLHGHTAGTERRQSQSVPELEDHPSALLVEILRVGGPVGGVHGRFQGKPGRHSCGLYPIYNLI